ncbi:MAG: GLPGLI family protein, partial [Flavobacteriales bacterium]
TLIVGLILSIPNINAQKTSGKLIYKRSVDWDMDKMFGDSTNTKKKNMWKDMINKMMKKTNERELIFNDSVSLFQYHEKEGSQGFSKGGMQMHMSMMSRKNDKRYINFKTGKVVQQKEFMGKMFLIDDTLDKDLKWKLTGDKKKVKGLLCKKATLKLDSSIAGNFGGRYSSRMKSDSVDAELEAWYTPMIPISTGPQGLHGLPGLILAYKIEGTTNANGKEMDFSYKMTVKNINVGNVKEEIEKPDKGKKVTKKEYQKITKEKIEEMREMRGSGGSFH